MAPLFSLDRGLFHGGATHSNFNGVQPNLAETVKKELAQQGVIAYEDAYALALNYIRDFPTVTSTLQKRFPFVFLDEMQDTGEHQWQLLHNLFNTGSVFQCFGDPNQAIYNSAGQKREPAHQSSASPTVLTINTSKRFSNSIAAIASRITAEPQIICGNETRNELPPSILLFSQTTKQQVLHKFCELIEQHGLHERETKIFKAVGLVAKPSDDKYHLGSYFTQFSREKKKRNRTTFPSFLSCLDYARSLGNECTPTTIATIRKLFFAGIIQCLQHEGIHPDEGKHHDINSIAHDIRNLAKDDYGQMARRMAELWINLAKGLELSNTDAVALLSEMFLLFKTPPYSEITRAYIESPSAWITPAGVAGPQQPALTQFNGTNGITVDIDTIHAVKGETHDATLVLDTHWHDLHLAQLIDYLCGVRPKKAPALRMGQKLKYAFVAMTRPRHLLCLAMDVSSVSRENQTRLKNAGWALEIL